MFRAPLSSLVAILAALSLVATGTARLAAAAPAGAIEMVICAGGEATTVMVDATGSPVPESAQHRHCGDCFMAGDHALPAAPSAAAATARVRRAARPRTSRRAPRRTLRLPEARAPPAEER